MPCQVEVVDTRAVSSYTEFSVLLQFNRTLYKERVADTEHCKVIYIEVLTHPTPTPPHPIPVGDIDIKFWINIIISQVFTLNGAKTVRKWKFLKQVTSGT